MQPSQLDIDLLAVYIETAQELRAEPFFDIYETPRTSEQGGELIVMELGDRFHFRSALIPFRRIWRKNEDSYFGDILDLVTRHDSSANVLRLAGRYRAAHKRLENEPSCPPHVNLPGKEVVDSWLYSVFVHTNLNKRNKKSGDYDRTDFQRNVERVGHGWYEYAFRQTVQSAGWMYFGILDWLARPLFSRWRTAGLTPSFAITSAFGSAKREKAPDGSIIIRQSSSFYGVDETLIEKFHRLLRRFKPVEDLVKGFDMRDEELLKVFLGARNVRDLITDAGFELHLAEYYRPPDDETKHLTAQFFDFQSNVRCNYWSTRDRLLIADKNSVRAWSRQFSQLKDLLCSSQREDVYYVGLPVRSGRLI